MKKYTLLFIGLLAGFAQAQNSVDVFMIARNLGEKVIADGSTIRVFGFAESLGEQPNVPGPTIYANEGDSVHIDLWNISQGAPHTIHLHGLDVDQENDGVPHLSFDIPHMEHGYYHFKAPHAGTYLYHCHVASTIHVQAGMYGLVIIRPPNGEKKTWAGGYDFDVEASFLLSEIDTNWHKDAVLEHDHDTSTQIHQVSIPVFEPQFFLVNGFSDQQLAQENIKLTSMVGAVNYVRLSNIGYCANRIIFPAGMQAQIIDSDGRPLPQAETSDTVFVFPGERYGVLLTATAEMVDSIRLDYLSMNNMQVKNAQHVPVIISGHISVSEFPESLARFDVSPNPFQHQATVHLEASKNMHVELRIFDLNGRPVKDLVNRQLHAGSHSWIIGEELKSSGMYLIQLVVDGKASLTKRIVKE